MVSLNGYYFPLACKNESSGSGIDKPKPVVRLLKVGETYPTLYLRPDWQSVPIPYFAGRNPLVRIWGDGVYADSWFAIQFVTDDTTNLPRLTFQTTGSVGDMTTDPLEDFEVLYIKIDGEDYDETDEFHRACLFAISQMIVDNPETASDIVWDPATVEMFKEESLLPGHTYFLNVTADFEIPIPTIAQEWKEAQVVIYLYCAEDVDASFGAQFVYDGKVPDTTAGWHKLILTKLPGNDEQWAVGSLDFKEANA